MISRVWTWLFESRAGATSVIASLVALTLWIGWNSHTEVEWQGRERFEFRVKQTQFAIEQRLLAYEQVLKGGVGLFRASDSVTREVWHDYVESLGIDRHYPGIQGVGFSKRILPSGLDRHVEEVHAQGFTDYRVWPMAPRREYTAILYLEPFDWRNQRAFGYDMFSEPVRQAAMMHAQDSGSTAVSGKVTLVQETDKGVQHGFLMYLPVYAKGHIATTVNERRAALLGYVYSPFRMNDLMQGILGEEELPDIRLEVFDGSRIAPQSVLFDSQEGVNSSVQPSLTSIVQFEINGRTWIARFSSLPPFEATIDWQKPYLILLVGLMVCGLFAATLGGLAMNRRRAAELARLNQDLQAEVTARVKLAAELGKSKEEAEVASRAKSDFMANVSHELRTPLTLILAPLEDMFDDAKLQPALRRSLKRIQRNALLLLGRVNEILDFAKAESGKFEVSWETVHLEPLLAPLIEEVDAVASRKSCRLSYHVDSSMGAVCLDPILFEKIAMNLLSNALKFTPDGGEIQVEARLVEPRSFEFSVANSGSGISEKDQARLFQRFQQLDVSVTRQYGGSGLGLALVKDLAELMNGQVGVENRNGSGVRFFVRFPRQVDGLLPIQLTQCAYPLNQGPARAACMQEGSSNRADDAESLPLASLAASRSTVLVADDTPDMRLYISEVLSESFNVVLATDGLQAWDLLQRQSIDVVVSDIMMPTLDGLGLTTRIKASPSLSHIPVILVTARGGVGASVSGLDAGADDYVAKPFSVAELRSRVNSALRMAKIHTLLREQTRDAGMAMLASGILHNLGNALNGVTVSASLVRDRLQKSGVVRLRKVTSLLKVHGDQLEHFLTRDPTGQRLPEFLAHLSDLLETEQAEQIQELKNLKRYLDHAVEVVNSHRRFTRATAAQERVSADELMETALNLSLAAFELTPLSLERCYEYRGVLSVERYKVSQILINLLVNAQQALLASSRSDKKLTLRTRASSDEIILEVSDNGIGIDAAHMPRLFTQGFSTKSDGLGLGLHLCAAWAQELGGRLDCSSSGPGMGATFTLKMPLESVG